MLMLGHAASAAPTTAREAIDAQDYPKAIELLSARIANHPDDSTARFDLARALGWNGNFTDAIAQYDVLLTADPDNADYLLGRANTHLWNKNYDAALVDVRAGKAVSPGYVDLLLLEIKILIAGNYTKNKQQILNLRQQLAARFPAAPLPPLPNEERKSSALWLISAGFSRETLSNNSPDWSDAYLLLGYKSTHSFYLQSNETRRFSQTNHQLTAGYYFPLPQKISAHAMFSYSDDYSFLPSWTALGEIYRPLNNNWSFGLGFKHADYVKTFVQTIPVKARYSRGPIYYTLQLNPSRVNNQFNTYSQDIGVGALFNRGLVEMGFTYGEELEHDGINKPISYDIWALRARVKLQLRKNLDAYVFTAHHQQDTLYSRDSYGTGIEYRH